MRQIVFCGYSGKIGRVLLDRLKLNKDYEIIGLVNSQSPSLEDILQKNKCDIVIDFTKASVAYQHALMAFQYNCHFVSGTTGLDKKQLAELARISRSKNLTAVICPNFTKGINLLHQWLPKLAQLYPEISIEEKHHVSKLDKPSGTAKMLGNDAGKSVSIKSIRWKKKCAEHKIIMSDDYESVIIIHYVNSYDAYADMFIKALDSCGAESGLRDYV